MKKIILFLVIMLILLLLTLNVVYARTHIEKNYINGNGFELTTKEYNFINEFYGKDFFENMTIDDYIWIDDMNINEGNVTIVNYTEYNKLTLKAPTYSHSVERLTIAKSCTSFCRIILKNEWLREPRVRSYDVMGARFENTSLSSSTVETKIVSSAGTTILNDNKIIRPNGFGVSLKLPNSVFNIRIEQKFDVTLGGTEYGSYQHATKNISLINSQKYEINSNGAGKVFKFKGSAIGVYENMEGVDISV